MSRLGLIVIIQHWATPLRRCCRRGAYRPDIARACFRFISSRHQHETKGWLGKQHCELICQCGTEGTPWRDRGEGLLSARHLARRIAFWGYSADVDRVAARQKAAGPSRGRRLLSGQTGHGLALRQRRVKGENDPNRTQALVASFRSQSPLIEVSVTFDCSRCRNCLFSSSLRPLGRGLLPV